MMKNRNSFIIFLLALTICNNNLIAQSVLAKQNDSIVQFIFTSDVHFGLVKDKFKNANNVSAYEVNKAMANVMNHLKGENIPNDGGVLANNIINGIDAVVITGDIANRMENGVQSATRSWEEFKTVFIDSLDVRKTNRDKSDLFVVPGNHDMSNAIGFHRKMEPKKDPAAMIGIYNLMFPNKKVVQFDSSLCRVHYSKDINNVHFIFLSLYPDSAERVWMEQDLKNVATSTPVLLFAHSIPEVEPRFFENPNGIHDINDEDKFENLVPERYKDGKDVKGETKIEQNAFVAFVKKHANIKVYFHGHENFTQYYTYQGPNKDINLTCIRTDSPMKGRVSAKDETKLAFELVTINTYKKTLSVREVLWNDLKSNIKWGDSKTIIL
jgi:hypothetical protein